MNVMSKVVVKCQVDFDLRNLCHSSTSHALPMDVCVGSDHPFTRESEQRSFPLSTRRPRSFSVGMLGIHTAIHIPMIHIP